MEKLEKIKIIKNMINKKNIEVQFSNAKNDITALKEQTKELYVLKCFLTLLEKHSGYIQ